MSTKGESRKKFPRRIIMGSATYEKGIPEGQWKKLNEIFGEKLAATDGKTALFNQVQELNKDEIAELAKESNQRIANVEISGSTAIEGEKNGIFR